MSRHLPLNDPNLPPKRSYCCVKRWEGKRFYVTAVLKLTEFAINGVWVFVTATKPRVSYDGAPLYTSPFCIMFGCRSMSVLFVIVDSGDTSRQIIRYFSDKLMKSPSDHAAGIIDGSYHPVRDRRGSSQSIWETLRGKTRIVTVTVSFCFGHKETILCS